jgi:hypothetical protein
MMMIVAADSPIHCMADAYNSVAYSLLYYLIRLYVRARSW